MYVKPSTPWRAKVVLALTMVVGGAWGVMLAVNLCIGLFGTLVGIMQIYHKESIPEIAAVILLPYAMTFMVLLGFKIWFTFGFLASRAYNVLGALMNAFWCIAGVHMLNIVNANPEHEYYFLFLGIAICALVPNIISLLGHSAFIFNKLRVPGQEALKKMSDRQTLTPESQTV